MKRICYLLVLLMAGFSFAANENSQRSTFLLSQTQTADAQETETFESGICEDLLPEETSEPEMPSAGSFIQVTTFISCAKR